MGAKVANTTTLPILCECVTPCPVSSHVSQGSAAGQVTRRTAAGLEPAATRKKEERQTDKDMPGAAAAPQEASAATHVLRQKPSKQNRHNSNRLLPQQCRCYCWCSVLEVAHACCDDGHAVLVAAVDGVLVADAAAWVGDGSHTSLTAGQQNRTAGTQQRGSRRHSGQQHQKRDLLLSVNSAWA